MKSRGLISIIFTTLLVVIFGCGSAYLVTKGIEAIVVNSHYQNGMIASPASSDLMKTRTESSSDKDELTIMVGGDVMFDRGVRAIGKHNGYDSLFDPSVISLFEKADLVAVNLESPITSQISKTLVNGKTTDDLTFTSATEGAQALAHAGITLVSLANNHTDNFGFSGFTETQDWLSRAGVSWFGNPWNSTSSKMNIKKSNDSSSPIVTIVRRNGFTIAFVGYHSFQPGIDRVISEIKRVSGLDVFTIVMPHWGEEYVTTSSELMKSQVRAFITAGADAVIGTHPHIIMNQEWIGTVPVYYSVGNLLFDQYFSPEVMNGIVVELHITKDISGLHLNRVETYNINLKQGKGTTVD